MPRKLFVFLSLALVVASMLTACATPAAPATEVAKPTEKPGANPEPTVLPSEPVTIEWWHIQTVDPGLTKWQEYADAYMGLHPNVTINITVLENQAFKDKLTTVMQSGNPPDIFQSWGGGTMKAYTEAGMTLDITPDLDADGGAWRNTFAPGALAVYSKDGKNYGVPWDMGMVGVWYNKDLFAQAGISEAPTTWTAFLEDAAKLKAAGIVPIALGEKDSWTGMHIWAYLAIRLAGQAGLEAAISRTGAFTDAPFVQAGYKLQELIATDPFQPGYLGDNHDAMQGHFGNGECAMEISGQWAPTVQAAQSADKKGVPNLGIFAFPAVEGGAGDVTDVMGGGNGFAIGKDAPPEAVDFVKFLTTAEKQAELAGLGLLIPTVKGGEAGLTDPNMVAVQAMFANAKYFAQYLDQALTPAMGDVINAGVQDIFTGVKTPEELAQAIEDIAQTEL
ncbi:MAG: extracellular solute-binding protein [Anaerolineales bacterium]|nr:extracellular solute-binding protein [Anaerolineales bacterium]